MSKFDFKSVEPKVLGASQKGQDSFIQHVFERIGETNKFFVEFGAVNGVTCSNTYFLRTQKLWNGVLFEPGVSDPSINLFPDFLTVENCVSVFNSRFVPKLFDFLCVDIDGNDFWITKELLKSFSPRVIMVETCVRFSPEESFAQKYHANYRWNGKSWVGSSPLAFKNMLSEFGYTIVHIHLDDLIAVKNSELTNQDISKKWIDIYPSANPDLYLSHGNAERNSNEWVEIYGS